MNVEDMPPGLRREHLNRCADAYYLSAQPIIKRMCELKLMFTTPQMVFTKSGQVEHSEKWTDESAKTLYGYYEKTLEVLKDIILKSQL